MKTHTDAGPTGAPRPTGPASASVGRAGAPGGHGDARAADQTAAGHPAAGQNVAGPNVAGQSAVDVRGPRFSSALTAVVLAAALIVQGPVGIGLVGVQVAVFAIAVARGVTHSPWAAVFRFVRDRFDWGPPPALEDATAPRFAQACGLAFTGAGLVALLVGAPVVGWVLTGIVLALATLLATTGLCVGCEIWLGLQRLRARTAGGA